MTHRPRPEQPTGLPNVAVVLTPTGTVADLGETPRRDRRRSRARRAATACAGVITAAAIIAGTAAATGVLPGTGAPADASPHQAGAPAAPVAAADPSAEPRTDPPADEPAERISIKRVGKLITTNTAHSGGKLTLWFSESHDGRLFLSLGARDARGALRDFGSAVAPSRLSAGTTFRATADAVNGDSEPRDYALVGIVTGDVSRVTLTVDGRPRTARVESWSEDPRVHAWWVLGDKLDRWPGKAEPIKGEVNNLTAYGPDGQVVARGDDGANAHG